MIVEMLFEILIESGTSIVLFLKLCSNLVEFIAVIQTVTSSRRRSRRQEGILRRRSTRNVRS